MKTIHQALFIKYLLRSFSELDIYLRIAIQQTTLKEWIKTTSVYVG